jgi:hypothetical protein
MNCVHASHGEQVRWRRTAAKGTPAHRWAERARAGRSVQKHTRHAFETPCLCVPQQHEHSQAGQASALFNPQLRGLRGAAYLSHPRHLYAVCSQSIAAVLARQYRQVALIEGGAASPFRLPTARPRNLSERAGPCTRRTTSLGSELSGTRGSSDAGGSGPVCGAWVWAKKCFGAKVPGANFRCHLGTV